MGLLSLNFPMGGGVEEDQTDERDGWSLVLMKSGKPPKNGLGAKS